MTYRNWNWVVQGKLAQGGYPGTHPGLFQAFDTIVFTAEERQPRFPTPAGKLVLYVPLDDDIYRPVPPEVGLAIHQVATQCARRIQAGKSVLSTCQQGRNRSGLVTALTLMKLYPSWTTQQVITLIQRNRKTSEGGALENPMFTSFLLAQRR